MALQTNAYTNNTPLHSSGSAHQTEASWCLDVGFITLFFCTTCTCCTFYFK